MELITLKYLVYLRMVDKLAPFVLKGQFLSTNDCKSGRVKRGLTKDSGFGLKYRADISCAINHIEMAKVEH